MMFFRLTEKNHQYIMDQQLWEKLPGIKTDNVSDVARQIAREARPTTLSAVEPIGRVGKTLHRHLNHGGSIDRPTILQRAENTLYGIKSCTTFNFTARPYA